MTAVFHNAADLVGRQEALGVVVKVCPSHGDFYSTGAVYFGRTERWSKCPACVAEASAAEALRLAELQAGQDRARVEAMLNRSAIPARFIGRSFEGFTAMREGQRRALDVAKAYAESFDARAKAGHGLVFSGAPGTGKSHLAAAILQSIMPRRVGLYITCMQLIRMVRATWRRDSDRTEDDVINMLADVPLLVIDEIGVQYGTDGEQTVLFEVLDRRYCDLRPTILLTNQDKEGFKGYIGERSFDRLTETSRWVAFDWDSHRPQTRKAVE